MTVADIEDIFELTPLQHGMLFHSIAEPDAAMYFEQVCFDFHATLDLSKFRYAWAILVDRHQILRTAFYWKDLEKPLQVVHRHAPIDIVREDWSQLSQDEVDARFRDFLHTDRRRGVQLDAAPLLRISLFSLRPADHRFVASFHHALLDGWSLGNLFNEFGVVYDALLRNGPYPLEPITPYGEYLRWLQEQDPTIAEAHWRGVLAGYSGPAPVFDVTEQTAFAEVDIHLDEESTSRLTQVANQLKVTLNTVVQGALGALLWRHTGERDVVFGAVVSGRSASLAGIESMVGLFINTIPVRVVIDPERSLADELTQLQNQQLEGRDHSHVSLVDIQGWSEVPRGVPLFNTLLIFENHPMGKERVSRRAVVDGTTGSARAHERTNYPLTVLVSPGAALGLKIQCVGASEVTAQSIANHLASLLEAIGRRLDRPVSSLAMQTTAEIDELLGFAQGRSVERPFTGLHESFERQVASTPDALAVSGAGLAWSYEQLSVRSRGVAAVLVVRDIGPGDVVCVHASRTPWLAAMVLGVLRVGAAFLLLDTSLPAARIRHVVSDSGARVVLTSGDAGAQTALLDAGCTLDVEVLPVDDRQVNPRELPPPFEPGPHDAAYVIYTSGSTGRPKGIVQTLGATVNRFEWMWDAFPFHPGEVACQKTAVTFVDAIWELLGPLLAGVPVRFIDDQSAAEPGALLAQLVEGRVTRLLVVPSLLSVLLESSADLRAELPDLEICVCSGEQLHGALAHRFVRAMPGTKLLNLYGSSEVAGDVTAALVTAGDDVSIGAPIDNVAAYVLDDGLEPVAVGVPGELYVGGAAVARGYLGRPGLTAEHFVPDPFTEGGRLFRTGDRARFRKDGRLLLLGRNDHQVKLRGVRIELGEVEEVLSACPGVDRAIVTLIDSGTPRARLAASVTVTDAAATETTIRRAITDQLPAVMIPAVIEIVDALPLLHNGKVDRLAVRPGGLTPAQTADPPATETERRLATVWQEVLTISVRDRHTSFFALGGHSLTVMQLGSRVRREFGVEVSLRDLFDAATLSRQAAVIDGLMADGSRPLDGSIRRLDRAAATLPSRGESR